MSEIQFKERKDKELPWRAGDSFVLDGVPYEIISRLGAGVSSVVYLIRQFEPKLEQVWKIIKEPLSDTQLEQVIEEAEKLSTIKKHPNIPVFYELKKFGYEGREYVALRMEFIPGKTLQKSVFDGDTAFAGNFFPLEKALDLIRQIANGLKPIHEQGIAHEDVKPENILVHYDFATVHATLIDFGIIGAEGPSPTGNYVAPEILSGSSSVDDYCPADIWSLGVILYRLLNKRKNLPFSETGFQPGLPVFNVADEINPAMDSELKKIVEKALSADPKSRYQNAEEFLQALDVRQKNVDSALWKKKMVKRLGVFWSVVFLLFLVSFSVWYFIPEIDAFLLERVGLDIPRERTPDKDPGDKRNEENAEGLDNPGIQRGILDYNFGIPCYAEEKNEKGKTGLVTTFFWVENSGMKLEKGSTIQIGYDAFSPYRGKAASPRFILTVRTSRGKASFTNDVVLAEKKKAENFVFMKRRDGYFQADSPISGEVYLVYAESGLISSKYADVNPLNDGVVASNPRFNSLRVVPRQPLGKAGSFAPLREGIISFRKFSSNPEFPYWHVAEFAANDKSTGKGVGYVLHKKVRLHYREDSDYARGDGPNFLLRFELNDGRVQYFTNSSEVRRKKGRAVLLTKNVLKNCFELEASDLDEVATGEIKNIASDFGITSVHYGDGAWILNLSNDGNPAFTGIEI